MNRATLKWIAGLVLAAALVAAGYGLLFTIFMLYDDEGYVLISLKHFAEHGGLYDRVYSQYGPFFFLFYDGLRQLFHFEWSSTAGRLITLVNWTGTAACCALLVRRARAHWIAALFVFADVFLFLWIMIHEPMHPGGTLAMLVALGTWLGYEALRADRPAAFAVVVGLFGVALVCVKINVGIFFLAAGGLRLLMGGSGRAGRVGFGAAAAFAVLMPTLLMFELLGEIWVLRFAFVTTLSIAAVLITIPPLCTSPVIGWRANLTGVGAALGLLAVIVLGTLVTGTSWPGLLEGMLFGPLHHPEVYSFAVKWRPGTEVVALGSLAAAMWMRRYPNDRRLLQVIAWVRLAAFALYQLTLLPWFELSQAAIALCFGVPLAALFALPLRPAGDPRRCWSSAQPWLALMLVFQCLHAYPIAGSQLNWGTFLWTPLMVLGGWEALEYLAAARTPRESRTIFASVLGALAALAVFMAVHLGHIATVEWRGSEPVGLPRANHLRLPSDLASALRVLTENIQAHGDVLFSLPGTFSFNLWSGVPPPTLDDVTHWFSLLSPVQQQAIIDKLTASPRAVFLVQHNILHAIISENFRATGKLMDYLRANFHRAFAIEGYSLWVHNGREIAPLGTGRLIRGQPDQLELTLSGCAAPVARIELWEIKQSRWMAQTLTGTNAAAELTPLHLSDQPAGAAHTAPWPIRIADVSRLTIRFSAAAGLPPGQDLLVMLRDAAGNPVGEARILPADAFALPPGGVEPKTTSLPDGN